MGLRLDEGSTNVITMAGDVHSPREARRAKHNFTSLFKLISGALLAFVLVLGPAVAQTEEDPKAVVERLNAALLEVMKSADELGYDGRFEHLAPVLEDAFNFPFMARIATGRSWNEFDEAERERLVELFARMSTTTFAARFDDYGGEHFEITGERAGPRDSILVESRLVRRAKEPVGLDYLVRDFGEGDWQIIDVFLDSKFSELARQRSEFAAVLRDGGYASLIATIEDQIERLASEARAS